MHTVFSALPFHISSPIALYCLLVVAMSCNKTKRLRRKGSVSGPRNGSYDSMGSSSEQRGE